MRWGVGISGLWSWFDSTTDITSLSLPNGGYRGRIESANLAAFGEVAERLTLIGGLRFTHEHKDFKGRFTGRYGARALFDEAGERDYDMLGFAARAECAGYPRPRATS